MQEQEALLQELRRRGYTTESLQKELGGGYSITFLNRVRNGTAPLSQGLARGIKFVLANPGVDRTPYETEEDKLRKGIQADMKKRPLF
jgi:hypothetical protein